MLKTMESMHRTRGISKGGWDAAIYTIRGEFEKAAKAERDQEEAGLGGAAWWNAYQDLFAPVDEAEMAEILAHVEKERQWYEQHKDDPLF